MRGSVDRTLTTAILLLTSIIGWIVAANTGLLASGSKILLYLIANVILTFDTSDLIARLWVMRRYGAAVRGPSVDLCLPEISYAEMASTLQPYAIIASIHDAAEDIDRFVSEMAPFKDVMWLIDDASKDGTVLRLRGMGWHCISGVVNRKKPAALLHLLKSLPVEIQTVLVLDPDVRWAGPPAEVRGILEKVISDLQRSGAAAFSPRICASRRGWLAECQALEYEFACELGRKSMGDLSPNSGASVYRRVALERVLQQHSLSVYAEDLENSLLLLAAGERIYYDDRLVFFTEPKRTLHALFSQRVGWAFGWAKMFLERMPLFMRIARRSPLAAYQYVFYLGFNGIVMLPLKLSSIFILIMSMLNGLDDLFMLDLIPTRSWNNPLLFSLWYVKTLVVLFITCLVTLPRGERQRHFITLPFYGIYALLQFAPITVGFANVLTLRLFGRRIYADHFDLNPQLRNSRNISALPVRN